MPGLRDIKPPLEVSQSLFPYLLVGLFAALAISGWLYIRKRQTTSSIIPSVAGLKAQAPHDIAYEQLAAIEASGLLGKGDMNVYHTQVSFVIREYINARYQIPALELPTRHLLAQLERQSIGRLYIDKVQDFLTNCDKVKFAKYHPMPSEAGERMVQAKWFVDVTKMPD